MDRLELAQSEILFFLGVLGHLKFGQQGRETAGKIHESGRRRDVPNESVYGGADLGLVDSGEQLAFLRSGDEARLVGENDGSPAFILLQNDKIRQRLSCVNLLESRALLVV